VELLHYFSICLNCVDRDSFAVTLVLYAAFILSLQAPSLSWNEVIIELDYAEFMVKDRQGLTLLFAALRLGLQNQVFHPEMFPVDLFYRHWKNAEGQVS
jgi:CCR4-NOT transcription complex subunit 1